jgi:hypothetical protein
MANRQRLENSQSSFSNQSLFNHRMSQLVVFETLIFQFSDIDFWKNFK